MFILGFVTSMIFVIVYVLCLLMLEKTGAKDFYGFILYLKSKIL